MMGVVVGIVVIAAGAAVGAFSVVRAVRGQEAGYLVGVGASAIVLVTGVMLLIHHIR